MKNKFVKVSALAGLLALPGIAAAQSLILDGDSTASNGDGTEQVTVIVNATVSGFLRLVVFNNGGAGTNWSSTSGAQGTISFGPVDAGGLPPTTGHREVFTDGALYVADLGAEVKFSGYTGASLDGVATDPDAIQDVRAFWNCGPTTTVSDGATAYTVTETLGYGGATGAGTVPYPSPGHTSPGPNNCFSTTNAGARTRAELDVGLFIGDTAIAGIYSATYTFTATAS